MRPRPGELGLVLVGAMIGAAVVLGARTVLPVAGDGQPTCEPVASHAGWSVAREWNEALLDAIRRDLPAPTIHARNLFHASVAMWDAWAAFDPVARGYLVEEHHTAADPGAAREEAISYAAYRVLEQRYFGATGASDSLPQFSALMEARCYPIAFTSTDGDSPAALGNRIAAAVLAAGRDDGSNEAGGYEPPQGYEPVNDPLVVSGAGANAIDPNRWQPLQIENMVSQNGIPVVDGVQRFIGPHWGHVRGFALREPTTAGLPLDPGPPPYLGDPVTDQAFKDAAVEVIRFSSLLDPADSPLIDVSPRALGGNPLGTNDGLGHPVNPATGRPYEANLVSQADFQRVVAEFWADGPDSETPPGHWNALANAVSDDLAPELRLGGTGPVLDRLEWDVKLYLALNGANHDAAIVAWGVKGHYDYARPIAMIRHLGGLGQSSDPDGEAYHPDGLPLEPGLVEVVTDETTAAGGRHAALAGNEGEIAVRSWTGVPDDPGREIGGVGWVLAVAWVPYQLPTFVTPAFAGYVSGHSTFSHASAAVLEAMTGDRFFPGGLSSWTIPAGSLRFEAGPDQAVVLQWATYADAADQAGLSRLYGGIHVEVDDLLGRRLGDLCGREAWRLAARYYGGDVHDAA
jgi:hypothetical protein